MTKLAEHKRLSSRLPCRPVTSEEGTSEQQSAPGPSVVYIGGTGRSGSTLLARLLSGVPGVVAVGEFRYVLDRGMTQDHLCGCGRPFRACPFWHDVFQRALPDGDDTTIARLRALGRRVDRNRYIPMHLWPRLRTRAFAQRQREYGEFLTRVYQAIAEVSGAAVIVDSSKDPSYAFVLHSTAGVDLGILHLLRDSRAVAFSWTRERVRPEVHSHEARMATRSPLRTSVLWDAYHLLFEWLERHSSRFRRVRYEDFVADPERSLADIVRWLQADAADDGPRAAPVVHDISGNPLRFSDAPLAVTADDEWKRALPARDFRVVSALTAPMLRRYGYRRKITR
jgi:sulfotransferase family protein